MNEGVTVCKECGHTGIKTGRVTHPERVKAHITVPFDKGIAIPGAPIVVRKITDMYRCERCEYRWENSADQYQDQDETK